MRRRAGLSRGGGERASEAASETRVMPTRLLKGKWKLGIAAEALQWSGRTGGAH